MRNTEQHFHTRYEIDIQSGCWNWLGYLDKDGYGDFRYHGKRWRAHRLSFLFKHRTIDNTKQIDHTCRNTSCVNPDHLEEVTCRENLMRGQTYAAHAASKTQCKRGHMFNRKNTYIAKNGTRKCRACDRLRKQLQ